MGGVLKKLETYDLVCSCYAIVAALVLGSARKYNPGYYLDYRIA